MTSVAPMLLYLPLSLITILFLGVPLGLLVATRTRRTYATIVFAMLLAIGTIVNVGVYKLLIDWCYSPVSWPIGLSLLSGIGTSFFVALALGLVIGFAVGPTIVSHSRDIALV